MATVLSTPIFIYNADDPANNTTKDGKESVTGRIEEALKALKPLDKARSLVQNALKALEGTAYEDIVKGLDAIEKNITATEQKVLVQITGGDQQTQGGQAQAPATAGVPTVGQISGREPLPEQSTNPMPNMRASLPMKSDAVRPM